MSETKKSRYTPSQIKASKKYFEKFDDIKIRVPKGRKDYYKKAAECSGESLNQFAIHAMDYLIEVEQINNKMP